MLVEAVTYRFRGHSMADPEQYRSKEEVEQWRERDPIPAFARAARRARACSTRSERERIDAEALARVDAAVAFADASPFPAPESLYDDVYVLDGEVRGLVLGRDQRAPPSAASARSAPTASRAATTRSRSS